jgi:hypothetical protein
VSHFNKNDSKKQQDENTTENENNVLCEKDPRASEIHRSSKANCKAEEISKLKNRCEKLIRSCIAASLVKLTVEEFKLMEGENETRF